MILNFKSENVVNGFSVLICFSTFCLLLYIDIMMNFPISKQPKDFTHKKWKMKTVKSQTSALSMGDRRKVLMEGHRYGCVTDK